MIRKKTFGFRLYQGGVPPGNSILVLNIPGIDVEACGGTHLNNTSEAEKIRIIKTERIQDGVNRIVFAAGKMADVHIEEETKLYDKIVSQLNNYYEISEDKNISKQLEETSKVFTVPLSKIEKTIQRFLNEIRLKEKKKVNNLTEASEDLFNEWKKTRKEKKQVSSDEIENLLSKAELIPGTKIKVIIGTSSSEGTTVAGAITKDDDYVVHIFDGKKLVSIASDNVEIDLREIAPEIGKILGGSGGGKPKMTQCGGPNKNKVNEALDLAKNLTKKKLEKT